MKDGGPAFPTNDIVFDSAKVSMSGLMKAGFSSGLTIRDFFAAKAMQTLIRNTGSMTSFTTEMLVEESYKIADAMLKEREK